MASRSLAALGVLFVLSAVPAAAQSIDARSAYFSLDYDSLITACEGAACDSMPIADRLLRLRALARSGRGDRAAGAAEALLREYPRDPAVLLTGAIAQLGIADLAAARRTLDLALASPGAEPEAWLQDALLRLMEQDAAGAVRSYREALERDAELSGTTLAYAVGRAVGVAARDPALLADVAAVRAAAAESRGGTAQNSRRQEAMFRQASSPLMSVTSGEDDVSIPIVPCFEDSPYWCVPLTVGEETYAVLLDTGNAPGFTVHHPALRDALASAWGADLTTSTGSVDTALVSRELLAPRLDFGPFQIDNVTGVFFPKPREPYFDANLNPFMLTGRVVTIDVPGKRLWLRTAERFREHLEVASPARTARLPVFGYDRFYVPVTANGREALAMIETGGEEVAVAGHWAERNGVAMADTTIEWRGKTYPTRRATIEVDLGPLRIGPARSPVAGGFNGPPTGMAWEVMLGPVALERFVISFDGEARVLVLEALPRGNEPH